MFTCKFKRLVFVLVGIFCVCALVLWTYSFKNDSRRALSESDLPDDLTVIMPQFTEPMSLLEKHIQTLFRRSYAAVVRSRKTGIDFCLITPGNVVVTNSTLYYRPASYTLKIDKPFLLSKYEVTQELYTEVMETNSSKFVKGNLLWPVENVTLNDTSAFLHRLCELEGVEQGTYRLPSAEEWEYACRAGNEKRFYTISGVTNAACDDLCEMDRRGWFLLNSNADSALVRVRDAFPPDLINPSYPDHSTKQVGQKLPNAFGLFDMYGNVSERTSTKTRVGTETNWSVACGGAYTDPTIESGQHESVNDSEKTSAVGFRVARRISL